MLSGFIFDCVPTTVSFVTMSCAPLRMYQALRKITIAIQTRVGHVSPVDRVGNPSATTHHAYGRPTAPVSTRALPQA